MRQESMRRTKLHSNLIFTFAIAFVAILGIAGCKKASSNAPPPRIESSSGEKRAETPDRKSQGTFARLLGRDLPPQYGWDGQYSVASTDLAPDVVFDRAMENLRSHNFSIQTEETRRQGASGRIFGIKQDKTTAQVLLSGKSPTQTEIKIKVGTTGDRTGSERLLDEILHPAKPK
jgi:hypothetical protein